MEALTSFTVKVDLQNPNKFDELPELSSIQTWCEECIQKESAPKAFEDSFSIVIRVVDSVESADLNNDYRQKEGPTNVLSFPNEVPEFMLNIEGAPEIKEQNSHLGDLVICEPLVKKEALEQSKPIMAHWAHLIVHGMLHLQGFDHIDDVEAEQMEALEVVILEKFGFLNPYNNLNQ